MANSYFSFKQFTVNQGNTAMKVGTDGVLLGAWCNCENAATALDIGTGTGLLALILAQKTQDTTILAIDIENIIDAEQNFENSPWSERLKARQIAVQNLEENKFDCIICNPPFFNNSLKCPEQSRSIARHTDTLNFSDLSKNCDRLLSENGKISLILPYISENEIIEAFEQQSLYANKICRVIPKINGSAKRSMLEFSRQDKAVEVNYITIETDQRHIYTQEYISLTKDYYLKL